jgi:hypothetical protein
MTLCVFLSMLVATNVRTETKSLWIVFGMLVPILENVIGCLFKSWYHALRIL